MLTRSTRTRPAASLAYAAVAAMFSFALPTVSSGTTAERCYPDWSDAAPIVRREALTPTRDLHDLARARRLGDLVRITLCEDAGRFVYRLVVFEPTRRTLSNLVVDARRPF